MTEAGACTLEEPEQESAHREKGSYPNYFGITGTYLHSRKVAAGCCFRGLKYQSSSDKDFVPPAAKEATRDGMARH
jgi:hypothetical protein